MGSVAFPLSRWKKTQKKMNLMIYMPFMQSSPKPYPSCLCSVHSSNPAWGLCMRKCTTASSTLKPGPAVH